MKKDFSASQREVDLVSSNDSEWRAYLITRFDKLDEKMEAKFVKIDERHNDMVVTVTTLKIKVGAIVSIVGAVAGFIGTLIGKHGG